MANKLGTVTAAAVSIFLTGGGLKIEKKNDDGNYGTFLSVGSISTSLTQLLHEARRRENCVIRYSKMARDMMPASERGRKLEPAFFPAMSGINQHDRLVDTCVKLLQQGELELVVENHGDSWEVVLKEIEPNNLDLVQETGVSEGENWQNKAGD